jgi:hypothetical protein
MVSIGSTYGVAQLNGIPKLSGFLAIIIKHLVNMHYLFGIGGLELCWEYMNHQFLKTNEVQLLPGICYKPCQGKKLPILAGALKNLPGLQMAAVRN